MNRTVTRAAMETYARILRDAKDSKALPEPAANALHARFKATDQFSLQWTVGIRTQDWHCNINGKWLPAKPPEQLQLDEDVAGLLDALSQAIAPAPQTGNKPPLSSLSAAPVAPPAAAAAPSIRPAIAAAGKVCKGCQQPLLADAAFCSQCGAPAHAPEPLQPNVERARNCANTSCGKPLPAKAAFCPSCGTKTAAPQTAVPLPTPPSESVPVTPAAIAARKCPACNAEVAPEKNFCTKCGRKM